MLVSIITPVLNGERWLVECIESVLTQSYPQIEHIFIDGGSTDGTVEILASYQAKYPDRIRFISEPDGGAGEAWNKGWDIAKGDLFGWLGADDMLCPSAIQAVLNWFGLNQDASFVFGRCNYIDSSGKIIGQSLKKDFNLNEMRQRKCYIPATSAFYLREVIKKTGRFNALSDEADYWERAGQLFRMDRIDDVLSNFRVHPDAISAKTNRWGGHYACYKFVLIQRLRPYIGFSYPLLKRLGVR